MEDIVISDHLREVASRGGSVFLLDLSWFLHRGFHAFRWMSVDVNGYSRPTGHIYSVFNAIESIRRRYPESVIVVCQDGVPVERNEIAAESGEGEGYKAGRPELEFNFFQDVPIIAKGCFLAKDVFWAYNADRESDDVMFALAKQIQYIQPDLLTVIYSGDNDLLQAIGGSVYCLREVRRDGSFRFISRNVVVDDEQFTRKFRGVDPEHLVLFRSIVGDSSDHIKGVPRFSRKVAALCAMGSESLDDMFRFQGVTKAERKWAGVLSENRELVERNYRLMRLKADFNVKLSRARVDIRETVSTLVGLEMNRYLRFLGVKGV